MARLAITEHERVKQRDEGFTLIELMFASVYLAVGLLAIAAMVDMALSRNVDARRLTVATNLATEMIERIRFNSPTNATSIVGFGYPYHNIQACNYACTGGPLRETRRAIRRPMAITTSGWPTCQPPIPRGSSCSPTAWERSLQQP